MDEWIRENYVALAILINGVAFSIIIYRFVAIKYNLPLPKWIKYGGVGSSGGYDGGPGGGGE